MQEISEVSVPSVDVEVLRPVLSELPITVAVLYGSHARQDATESSDIDLAVGFEEHLSSVERTRTRLALIERLSAQVESDEIDVIPLSRVPPALLREIRADGIVLYGSSESVPSVADLEGEDEPGDETREDRLAEFDDILADIERVV